MAGNSNEFAIKCVSPDAVHLRNHPIPSIIDMHSCDICPHSQHIVLSEISTALNTPLSLLDLSSSFVQNGGDSLASIQLQAGLRKHGFRLSFDTIFTASTLRVLAEDVALRAPKSIRGVLAETQPTGAKRPHTDTDNPSPKRVRRKSTTSLVTRAKHLWKRFPMTEMQLSLVHSTQSNPGRNVISYCETHRPENVPALKRAWIAVLEAEPIFNMSFEVGESGGYMRESEAKRFIWEEIIVQNEESYLQELRGVPPITSSIGVEVKAITLQSSKGQSKTSVIHSIHHALIDGVSFGIIRSKVRKFLAGEPTQPGPHFAFFSSQLKLLQEREHESAVRFWKRQKDHHSSAVAELLLPSPFAQEDGHSAAVAQVEIVSAPSKLAAYARKVGVTVTSLYYAAWGLVLSKYTDSDHVCFGVVLSGRTLPIENVESVVGPMINTLPFYLQLPHISLREFISQTFTSLLELTTFQWSTPAHGFTRNFASAINVRFDGSDSTFHSPSDSIDHPYSMVYSDIPIHVEIGNCGKIVLSYHANSFTKCHMKCLAANFSTALEAILNPNATITSCLRSCVADGQMKRLSKLGNWTSASTRNDSVRDTLVSLFVREAEANPSAAAVERGTDTLSYSELHGQSSFIARKLLKHIAPGDVVCVHADKTINWIIAIYAVLKTGATYCPLDKDMPNTVRDTNYSASGSKLFLTGSVAAKSRKPVSCNLCLSVEELLQDKTVSESAPGFPCLDTNAYICFTSGSTGLPKGVLCRHKGLVAFQKDFYVRLCARPGWRIAQFMSPGFDGSIHEIFSALSYGATLVLQDDHQPFQHLKMADSVILTPSVAKVLDPIDFPNLKVVYLVGEAVTQNVCDNWSDQRQLFNMYGPTEATCGATIKRLKPKEQVTLGNPNPSTRVYILDSQQRVVPLGVIGEVYLAGVQVAIGYIGRPRETAKRFLPDSINPEYAEELMYKTGDRAYWDENGELVLLGRNDRQIKLRGFRIDLDDLEIRMTRAHENCTAAAVSFKDDELVAFVQPANLDMDLFRSKLSQLIPPYALPRRIKAVKSFPMTPIGKLDYKAISNSESLEETRNDKHAAISEQMVTACLRDVLDMPANAEIDLGSSFTDMGASSILLISLSHRLSRSFRQKIPVRLIFSSASIRDLANALASLHSPINARIHSILGDYGVSPIEKDWWHKYQKASDTSSFNVTYSCTLPETLDRGRLISAWNVILCRHRILSSRYAYSVANGITRTYSQDPPVVKNVEQIEIDEEINIPFRLAVDDMIRVLVSPTDILVVVSHIICDLTTLRILLQEVAQVYYGRKLAPMTKTYFQHAWTVPAQPSSLSFWSKYLSSSPKSCLSIGKSILQKTWSGSSYLFQIPKRLYSSMLEFSSTRKVTMHQLAVAAVALALQHKESKCDITIGAPYLNRNCEDDLDVVGLFLEPLPIRIQYPHPEENLSDCDSSDSSLGPEWKHRSFIKSVQRSSRAALSHAVPWDQLLSHLNVNTDYPNHPIFDTMVTYHDTDHDLKLPIDGIQSRKTYTKGSKFKIMAEFTASRDGTLDLRLEYSDECFVLDDMKQMVNLLMTAIKGLVADNDYGKIVKALRSMSTFGGASGS